MFYHSIVIAIVPDNSPFGLSNIIKNIKVTYAAARRMNQCGNSSWFVGWWNLLDLIGY